MPTSKFNQNKLDIINSISDIEAESSQTLKMNKSRLENLTDAVFAIVMTLIVIEIHVPEIINRASAAALLNGIDELLPLFGAYFVSFVVLAMYWQSHHFLFQYHAKNINRVVVLLNMLYLSFISLIPFSSNLLGNYNGNQTAVVFYGLNLLLVSLVHLTMYYYVWKSRHIENGEVSTRIKRQGEIRAYSTIGFVLIGMSIAFFAPNISLIFYTLPIIFNIVPGLLNLMEKTFNFEIK